MHNNKNINFNWILWYSQIYTLLLSNFRDLNKFDSFSLKQSLTSFNLYRKSHRHSNLSILNKPNFNRNASWNKPFDPLYSRSKISSRINFFKPLQQVNLFNLYLYFSSQSNNIFFTPHANFQPLFISNSGGISSFINVSKVYTKWVNSYNFLLNIFFSKLNMFLFSNRVFRNEILSFNWSCEIIDYKLFKFANPYFFMKDTNFGVPSSVIFKRFKKNNLNLTFILDLKFHEKNLAFFRRINMYTIALVPYNMNPWLVSYSFPVSSNNIFIQYFFIKLLLFVRQYAELQLYNTLKSKWLKLL